MVTLAPNDFKKEEEDSGRDVCGNSSSLSNNNPDMQNNSILEIISERKKLTFFTPEETYSTTIPFDKYTTRFKLQLIEDGIRVEKIEHQDTIEFGFKFGSIVVTRSGE